MRRPEKRVDRRVVERGRVGERSQVFLLVVPLLVVLVLLSLLRRERSVRIVRVKV
jgi:hypothetical protein